MDIITIEKEVLIELIEDSVTRAVERALQPPDEVMTLDETARYLKRSVSHVQRLKKRGLPHRDNRFRKSEVDAWLAFGGMQLSK